MAIRRSSHIFSAFVIASATLLAAFPNSARAQETIMFERGGTIYATDLAAGAPPRTLLNVGSEPDALCAAAPDGRRIAWLVRAGAPAKLDDSSAVAAGLVARPAVVYVSDLSGRHRKKLFSTDMLHDRQSRAVSVLGLGEMAGKFEDWEPVSLSWSADSRTIYLSCLSLAGSGGKATFAADAASGLAVVDAADRWKSIAPAAFIDARGGLLVGAGLGRFSPAAPMPAGGPTSIRYGPLLVINLAEGTRTPLYSAPASTPESDLPDYAFVLDPALSPDGKFIAFSAPNKGLWIVERKTRAYRKLVDGSLSHPRWSQDGKSVLFLMTRPNSGNTPVSDLYAIDVPTLDATDTAPMPLRLILQTVAWFDVVPD